MQVCTPQLLLTYIFDCGTSSTCHVAAEHGVTVPGPGSSSSQQVIVFDPNLTMDCVATPHILSPESSLPRLSNFYIELHDAEWRFTSTLCGSIPCKPEGPFFATLVYTEEPRTTDGGAWGPREVVAMCTDPDSRLVLSHAECGRLRSCPCSIDTYSTTPGAG